MGLDDPKLLSVHVSFNGQVCAICALFFKVEHVLLLYNCVAIVIQSTSINSCWGCDIWSDPKSYNWYNVHICVPWVLEVDYNDPRAGTNDDCICCFCQLSICVGTCSIHRPWFLQGLVGCLALPSHVFMGAASTSSSTRVYCMVPGCKGQHANLAGLSKINNSKISPILLV